MEDNPFPDLKIADTSVLDSAQTRVACPNCGRKRMYFCYTCISYVNDLDKVMPTVHLPLKIDIIKHKQELDSKSTAVHAVLLAKDQCKLYSFPDIPEYNPETDALVFPSDDAVPVEQWSARYHDITSPRVRKVVFIDCTWNQINPIIKSPQLSALPRIVLNSYTTKFWRPNGLKRDMSCLATIEAVYFFVKEFHIYVLHKEYNGEYDNLLMLFKFLYSKIRDFHDGGHQLKAYKQ